jgi:hypothetical protein
MTMISRVAVVLTCLAGFLAFSAVASADEIEWMYDPDAVVEIHLGGLSEAELDELEATPDEYVHGSFELTVDGVPKGPLLTDVGIRLKGGVGSSRPVKTGKSGFKVRFDEFVDDQLFFGIKRLTLNNMIQDPSMVHESITYGLFRDLGLPASRTGYAFITLNGDDYGLFLNLETLDEVSLPQWFPTTGHLYEADAAKTDLVPGDATRFEVDEGDEEDISDLEALIAAVNDGVGDWSDDVSPFADLEQMTAHWAVERYVTHWDGYAGVDAEFRPNNYYLHSDTVGIFQMMPWGTDQTWQFNMEFDEPAGGIMFNECLADASCKQLYLEGLTDVYCVAPGLDLPGKGAQLATTLAPYQDREDPLRREATEGEIAAAVEDFEALATSRPEELQDYLTAEGVFGNGADPCPLPPEPEKPTEPGVTPPIDAPPPIVIAPALRFGPTTVQGNRVLTRVDTPTAGAVTQRVTARLDGRRVQVCSDQERRDEAARVKIRCHLSKAAREARAEGPLRLRVRVGFTAKAAKPRFSVRGVTASKRD